MNATLLVVFVIGLLERAGLVNGERENIAKGKRATLRLHESNHGPELVTDGDPNTFVLSQVQDHPTWRVDLEKDYKIDAVSITNRNDCCPDILNGVQIHIGSQMARNPRCAVVSEVPLGETYTYSCFGMVGRYITIVVPGIGKQLALAEVKVFEKIED